MLEFYSGLQHENAASIRDYCSGVLTGLYFTQQTPNTTMCIASLKDIYYYTYNSATYLNFKRVERVAEE